MDKFPQNRSSRRQCTTQSPDLRLTSFEICRLQQAEAAGRQTASPPASPRWRAGTLNRGMTTQMQPVARQQAQKGSGQRYRVAPTCSVWCRPAAGTSTPSMRPTPPQSEGFEGISLAPGISQVATGWRQLSTGGFSRSRDIGSCCAPDTAAKESIRSSGKVCNDVWPPLRRQQTTGGLTPTMRPTPLQMKNCGATSQQL